MTKLKRHKWSKGPWPNECVRCGLIRTRRTFKYLMAITNKPPYNHYKYESKMVYMSAEMTIYKAAPCVGKKL